MPPIEAMRKGKTVVMTRKTCLEEVTEGRAVYVDQPMEPSEWAYKIQEAMKIEGQVIPFEAYELQRIVEQYVEAFSVKESKSS
jgi:glycosyltransferase involved in cell wall biosynthesis